MSSDATEYQNPDEQRRARELSLQSTHPPGEAPGYEVQRCLGTGAYGEVWVATDRNTGRRVAIKFYLHRSGLDWTLLAREVEKLVFLSADRYVVQLLDVGWHAEPPYYVMEYVENGSLDDLLKQSGTLPAVEAVALFREVAIGLTHAHDKGVLHCDLKPANILLDQDRRPRLADFGQSRLSHEQTPALGTLFYMAPEQADLNALPDARWDVYALGAILHCLLTGEPPHRNDDALRRLDRTGELAERLACYRRLLADSPPPDLHRYVPGVDRALAEIVDRCLAVNPARRYANAQLVLDALETRDRARSRRPLLILGLVGPILLLTVMILFSWRAFTGAVGRSEQMVKEQAHRANQFAAKFVAKSFEAELADNFALLEQEAGSAEFVADFQRALASERLREINAPETPQDRLGELRRQLLNEPQRLEFQARLERRLDRLDRESGSQTSKFASIFVADAMGTWLAGAYADEVATVPIGQNFSWRTYFRGGQEDAPPARPSSPPPHIEGTHLSAAFKSSATAKWKIAVSTPVYDRSAAEPLFLGIVAITFNIGDFAVFRSKEARSDYFAVLIDNRRGDRRGPCCSIPCSNSSHRRRIFRFRRRNWIESEPNLFMISSIRWAKRPAAKSSKATGLRPRSR
jgi:eukaryotic-like serine/threonine-protein kinase